MPRYTMRLFVKSGHGCGLGLSSVFPDESHGVHFESRLLVHVGSVHVNNIIIFSNYINTDLNLTIGEKTFNHQSDDFANIWANKRFTVSVHNFSFTSICSPFLVSFKIRRFNDCWVKIWNFLKKFTYLNAAR